MNRTMRPATTFIFVLTALMLVACNNELVSLIFLSQVALAPDASPTAVAPPTGTPVPVSDPTLAQSEIVGLSIINAMPASVGRFTLDKRPTNTYVAKNQGVVVGLAITYTLRSGARLVYAIWIGQDASYALNRYENESSKLDKAYKQIPVRIGDEAFVAPTAKGKDDNLAFNPVPWGIVLYRNIVIDLYPTKTLTDQTSTTQSEAVNLLWAAYDALPK